MVDDQPMVRRLLAHLFSAEGYEVVEAEDGRWALEALGGTTPPDVCILDVMMPARAGEWPEGIISRGQPVAGVVASQPNRTGRPRGTGG